MRRTAQPAVSLALAMFLANAAAVARGSAIAPGSMDAPGSTDAHGSAPVTAHKTEHVFLVTLDGLRWQEVFGGADETLLTKENGGVTDVAAARREFWRDTPEARRAALMPFLWTVVAKQGQLFGNRDKQCAVSVTNGRKFSYPGYNEILTGSADDRIDSNDKKPNPNVSVLEWLDERPAFHDRIAAFASWDCFTSILNTQRSRLYVNAGAMPEGGTSISDRQKLLNDLIDQTTPPSHGVRHDSLTFYSALEHVKAKRPRVVYISFDQTDDFAHEGRYLDVLRQARQLDAFLRALWEFAQSNVPYRDKTTLLVSTDHGRGNAPSEWKDHGAKVAGAELIWIAAIGPDTAALGERANIAPLTQSQIAGTLAALLGEDYCAAMPNAGKPIADIVGAAAGTR
jgi:hypothetical protein